MCNLFKISKNPKGREIDHMNALHFNISQAQGSTTATPGFGLRTFLLPKYVFCFHFIEEKHIDKF